ncbi:hypothetical protein PQI07_27885 [Methylobacterium sp. 092160098-2]|uniref:hypothetical protein n=1 Tax=Methylobacterium sp. 092160098-2 TaxID=3025129 RepID=UPI0023819DCE|nr:hypothetical protein [Methylobacterium sp. 092160098-2]MDE4914489.1 hypothetical protein [Methylobacterium sp. 092160098-2]
MSGLLHRLFRYRATEKRTPLEDFLTEVLADFIARAPPPEAEAFVLDCFVPEALRDAFRSIVAGRSIEAATQVRLPDGRRLDLLLQVGGTPLIVVENKTWAAFQMHARRVPERGGDQGAGEAAELPEAAPVVADPPADAEEGDPPAVEYEHQLITYGRWLASAPKPEGWPGVLVVLTHAAQAPEDFVAGDGARYGVAPQLIRWRELHARLRRRVGAGAADPQVPAWMFVGRELCTFLETHAMDSSDLTPVEIASVNVALGPLRKLTAVFAEVAADLQQRYPDAFSARDRDSAIDQDNGRAWGWTYFKGGKFYVAYGVYFSPLSGEFATTEPPLPDHEHAFVALGAEERAIDPGPEGLPAGWVRIGDGWLLVRPFPLSDRRTGERFPQYLCRLVQDAWPEMLGIKDGREAATAPPDT